MEGTALTWTSYAYCYECNLTWLYQRDNDRICPTCGCNAQVHEQLSVLDDA